MGSASANNLRSNAPNVRLRFAQRPVAGSNDAATSRIVTTYPATRLCVAATKLRPLSMQPANRSSSDSINPLF